VETELGRKRAIDQSSCNKDFSCLNGFCPSFVTLRGAKLRKAATQQVDVPDLPAPKLPTIHGTHNVVITGVGGTGVVTIGAILAMAAHLDGKGAGMMEMAGLAQKGGAVHIHCRIAEKPEDISAVRVATGEADAVIGGDLVTTAGAKTLGLMTTGRTGAVVNSHQIITGDFTRNTEFRLPFERLELGLEARLKDRLALFDASELARALLGDSIYSNMMIFGAAWQDGLIPLSEAAILRAIELNGAAVEVNTRAFELGRWAAVHPDQAERVLEPTVTELPKTLEDRIAYRAEHLRAYKSRRYAARYRRFVDRFEEPKLKEAVAKAYHKLLAYKDEYEVARLHLATAEKARQEFDGDFTMTFHLAPPILGHKGPGGRPVKRAFGPWVLRLFRLLARMRHLRGTPLDPFGYSRERRAERAAIRTYEAEMADVLQHLTPERLDIAVQIAELPLQLRGFGPVKAANEDKIAKRRAALLERFRAGGEPVKQAAQ
jgi:indolepyruvate ferredoxin oxidoreductase